MEKPKHFDVVRHENAVVARLELSRILEDNKVLELGEELNGLVEVSPARKIVLDFSKVQFISSAALGKLIMTHKLARKQGRRLLFCNLQPPVVGIFDTTRLSELFEIHADEAAALAAP